ncbi:HMCES protein, partial [Mionectes macconnelli]|nr:HMCES protein [Mionectes macconnelli]
MCGRTGGALGADNRGGACAYRDRRGRGGQPEWVRGGRYQPSYNKGPGGSGPVLLGGGHLHQWLWGGMFLCLVGGDADSSERVLMDMRWGLVPSWFKNDDPSKLQWGGSNCRSEGGLKKSSYKGALLKGKGGVVLADGGGEWQQQQSGGKGGDFIYFPRGGDAVDEGTGGDEEWKGWGGLTMAGIFDCWGGPSGGEMGGTYTIITVDASGGVSFIHHGGVRAGKGAAGMPAILDGDEAIRKWLDFAEVRGGEAVKLMGGTENVVFHPVSGGVNSIRNGGAECVAPIELGGGEEVKANPSNTVLLGWLKSSQEGSPQRGGNDLPKWGGQFIHSPSPKKGGADILQQGGGKQGEPAAKKGGA